VGKFKLIGGEAAMCLNVGWQNSQLQPPGCKARGSINFLPIIPTKPIIKNTLSNCHE